MATKETSQGDPVHERVRSQFGAAASAYTTSRGHSDPSMLRRIVELANPRQADLALDIATGAGHTALAIAPHVARIVAYDITPQMLDETARNAASRGLTNVTTRVGSAENLPFEDASFDLVTVRHAPHHYADVCRAVREMARVARTGARVIIVDSRAPEDDALDHQLNHLEKLRDPSHVRSYRPSEWRAMIADSGLRVRAEELDFYTENGGAMDFALWTRRINTPPQVVAELTRLFRAASPELAEAIRLNIDGDRIGFHLPQITIAAIKD